jgi:inosine-uridine nucleoside N-ribohydrolase
MRPLADGMPRWGPEMDFNVQCDTRAASIVAASADLTLVTLPASVKAQLRLADLPRLRTGGPLGQLLARQSEANALDTNLDVLGRSFSGLPDDLVNFHWDPVTCAVAVGWPGAVVDELPLTTEIDSGVLSFVEAPHGRLARVVVDVDAEAFTETWINYVEAAPSRTR